MPRLATITASIITPTPTRANTSNSLPDKFQYVTQSIVQNSSCPGILNKLVSLPFHHDGASSDWWPITQNLNQMALETLSQTRGIFYYKIQSWCIPRVANLSLIALLSLLFLAFSPASRVEDTQDCSHRPRKDQHWHFGPRMTKSQVVLVYYIILYIIWVSSARSG